MNKAKKNAIIVCLALFVGVAVAWFAYGLLNPLPREYFIFENIEECEGLIPDDQSDVKIDRHDAPNTDKDLKDLPCSDFFGMKFESDTLEYEIFAYEFEDSDSALKYYTNVTGKSHEKTLPSDEEKPLLSASQGMFSYRVIVVSQNRAYKLIAPNKYIDEINSLLSEVFSQKLP